jgi:hypothetical protein
MPHSRAISWAAAGIWLATSLTQPVSSAAAPSGEFTVGFRIASYLRVAAEIQALSPEARVGRLRELARDPVRSQEIFPLCRMLFEARQDREFRRPMIGSAKFVGATSYRDWPLEPIVLFEGVPILVVKGYAIFGLPESATAYLDYCVKRCRWRKERYTPASSSQLKGVVNRLLAARPDLSPDAEWLRQQADEA